MRVPRFLTKSRNVIALTLVGATAGLGLGLGLTVLQAHDTPKSNFTPPECAALGSASFVGAESVADLVGMADVVVKGRIIDRSSRSDKWRVATDVESIPFLFYEVEVLDTIIGGEASQTVTLGLSFGEVCLEPGEDEYYLFLARAGQPGEAYEDDPERGQNPAVYGMARFGPQNVFTVSSGRVEPLAAVPALEQQTQGISEAEFQRLILESAVGIPRFEE